MAKKSKRSKKPVTKSSRSRPAAKQTGKKSAKKAVKTTKRVSPIPRGFHTVTPHLVCRNAAGAIEFYKKAFGARELSRMPMPGGGLAHAELQIGDSRLMLADEMPEMDATAPETIGGSAVHIFLYLKNVDAVFNQAVRAGAKATMPPTDMFWGDRYAKLTDPFGHKWSMATHIEDMSVKEMIRRGDEAFKQGAPTD